MIMNTRKRVDQLNSRSEGKPKRFTLKIDFIQLEIQILIGAYLIWSAICLFEILSRFVKFDHFLNSSISILRFNLSRNISSRS